ncbi:unnamed protein product, partial [Lampetra planeri]
MHTQPHPHLPIHPHEQSRHTRAQPCHYKGVRLSEKGSDPASSNVRSHSQDQHLPP